MKIIKNQVMAIIPARSGSKGVPGKNIRLLADHPLIAWSICAAQRSKQIDRIIISTDSEEYAAIARKYKAETPFLRPAEFSTDKSQDIDFFMHALLWLQENEHGNIPEYLVHLRPTAPLRDPQIIDQAIEKIKSHTSVSSLCSAHEVAPVCKYFKLSEDDMFSAYLGEELISTPRQDCERAFLSNGYVDVLLSEHILKAKNLYGNKRLAFISPQNEDIDEEEDFLRIQNSYKLPYYKDKIFY